MITSTEGIKVLAAKEADVHPFDWGSLTWFANRAIGNSGEVTVGKCVLKPGQNNPRHSHPNCSEILLVLRGKIRHTVSGKEQIEMGEGDTVSVPPDVPHQAVNSGEENAEMLIVFTSADRKTVGE